MDPITRLYQQFEPARPLAPDETDLYVNWQHKLGRDDIKRSLASLISRTFLPNCVLFSGHRGVGKTTELLRVKRMLEEGRGGRRWFVSFVESDVLMDMQDVEACDIVFHMVRKLYDDLKQAGFQGIGQLGQLFLEMCDQLGQQLELKNLKVPLAGLELGTVLKDAPIARSTLRGLLQGQLPRIYDLINKEVLGSARNWLRQHKGIDDILIIVDQLDRIPQKVINDQGLTNHRNIFLDHAGILKAMACDVLYTLPIDLAYSNAHQPLLAAYGSSTHSLPLIPVRNRDGSESAQGLEALCEIVETRARKAGVAMELFFEDRKLLLQLCLVSGGYIRNLFILLRSAMDRCDALPLTLDAVQRSVRRHANDLSMAVRPKAWEALRKVHATKLACDDDPNLWQTMLRDLFVLTYEDEAGVWYDWNPLLAEIPKAG